MCALVECQTWPEDAPAVAMDLRLGKKYEYVDVQPELLRDFLLGLGPNPDYLPNLTVVLKKPSLLFPGYFGTDHTNHTLELPIGKRRIKALAHEGQHFADYSNGKYDRRPKLTNQLTALGSVAGTAAGLVINEVAASELFGSSLIGAANIIVTAAAVGAQIGYAYSPAERSARRATKALIPESSNTDMIVLKKRP